MEKTMAMILAGGQGKRMGVLCHHRPKPALPFAGKFRIIDFSLSNCIHSEIEHITVLVDYQRHYMSDYLRQWRLANASDRSFHILEPRTGSYKGTADAVYQNLDYLQKYTPESVLVLAGDHIYLMDYRNMLAFHKRMRADATIGVVPIPVKQAHRFGIVTTNAEGRVTDFAEKPSMPTSNLASMGIYIFNRQTLVEYLVKDNAEPASPHDFGYAIIPKMVKQSKVFAYRFDGYWEDIGTIEAYYAANIGLTHGAPSLSLNGNWPILTKDNSPLHYWVFHQGNVKHSLISPHCVIEGQVENSILSSGVRIEEQAVVRNSVVMAHTVVGRYSVVNGCILGEEVNVGEFCSIGFKSSLIPDNEDVTVLGKGVVVPRHTAISNNHKVLSHTRLDDFAAKPMPSCSISELSVG